MSIIKFAVAAIGLAACVFNTLDVATAASFDKYLVAPLGTVAVPGAFTPFQVKASDSQDVEYLHLYYQNQVMPQLPCVFLSNLLLAERGIGCFSYRSTTAWNVTDLTWMPATGNDISLGPFVFVFLHTEIGVAQNGDIELRADTMPYCDELSLCYPSSKIFTAFRTQPKRITATNGDQIEAVPVIIHLDGAPWATYYFGYGVGLVAAEVFSPQPDVKSFTPVSLPPPKADGTVVEYVNTLDFPGAPGGHYFYTADPAEQAWIDAGGAGWFVRTGRSFASGGFVPVCRFYGSMSPGPNSHFFTASEIECIGLKAMQLTPTPATVQQWNYEGPGFYSVVPVPDAQGQMQCMAGTEPVYRAYNNAYPTSGGKNPWDSNHRYSTQSADIDEMVAKGWRSEGVVLCAPIAAQ